MPYHRLAAPALWGGFFMLAVLGVAPAAAQGLVVNELMSRNTGVLVDEDGDRSDWFELYNAGDAPVDLGGYGLSDDPDDPFKWTFDDGRIAPGEHLVVMASGKDRPGFFGHWETVIDAGHVWRYRRSFRAPPADWAAPDFDDASWDEGPSGFGYGDGDDATVVGQTTVLYVRTRFTVDDPAAVQRLALHVDYDDGFVAYLNGQEIARANVESPVPRHTEPASADHEAQLYQGGAPEGFEVEAPAALLRPGENVLAVRVHNVLGSSDLSLTPFLTLGLREAPAEPRGLAAVLEAVAGVPHTNFRLDADGESLTLTDPEGATVDTWNFEPMPDGSSFGRRPDGGPERVLFATPTPGASNIGAGFFGQAARPRFAEPGGRRDNGFIVALEADAPDAVIYYTTDGSIPDTTDTRYVQPFRRFSTMLVRARAFRPGYFPSDPVTQTYFVRESGSAPVISLVTDPPNLWDWERGIYVLGPGASTSVPFFGANFWQDWEIPMHVEFYEPDGSGFAMEMGARIFGAWSRAAGQKSFALFARARYGVDTLAFPVFPEHDVTAFQSLVLRNAGNDRGGSRLRDPLMHRLVAHLDLETQAHRPAVVFLNGEYWGSYNIREKINEDYLAAHHGVDPDRVDILEGQAGENDVNVVEGSNEHYLEMLDVIERHGVADPADYDVVRRMMDVENFIDYEIAQIFYANTDWPGNNIKFWRPQTPTGRWRWILFDTDFGFQGVGSTHAGHETLRFATDPNGPDWPNPPWSTFLLRRLLENDTFRAAFINRFADHLNDTFRSERILAVIDTLEAEIEPVLVRHFARWEGSMEGWRSNMDQLRDFGGERTGRMWNQLRSFFRLGELGEVRVTVGTPGGGRIRVNRLRVPGEAWSGRYFAGVPIEVRALPARGYRFTGWTGTSSDGAVIDTDAHILTVDPATAPDLTAHFEADPTAAAPVVINEIYHNPAPDLDTGDWVELTNLSAESIDLSGWSFSDADDAHVFVIPSGTHIAPEGFLVLARDPARLRAVHPTPGPVVGGWTFGLDGTGEAIRLMDADGAIVDSLTYGSEAPWPTGTAGQGFALQLVSPYSDNALPEAWERSFLRGGTPGRPNLTAVGTEDAAYRPEQPEAAALEAAYPNPFAARTTLGYTLPAPAHVDLAVYDVIGRRVAVLVDGVEPGGRHRATWHAVGLGPGVYVARLRVDGVLRGTQRVVRVR